MVKKVERYAAHDGREFLTEEAGLRHEAVEGRIAAVPELALIRAKLEASMNQISVACEPLARFLTKTTLGDHPETTPDHPQGGRPDFGELAGTCDCAALLNGDDNHAVSCPSFKPESLPRDQWGTPDVVDLADRLAGRA